MATIFLNLGPRSVGGELLPDSPFRAFVKFKTSYTKEGGVVVLKLEHNGILVGTAMMNWLKTVIHYDSKGRPYHVGEGAIDEYDIQAHLVVKDWMVANMICAAMEKATWPYHQYDHGLDNETAARHFEEWRQKHM